MKGINSIRLTSNHRMSEVDDEHWLTMKQWTINKKETKFVLRVGSSGNSNSQYDSTSFLGVCWLY